MVYDDRDPGFILGTRPGEIEGEDSFGAHAAQEHDDDLEDAQDKSELSQFETNRSHRGHAVSSLNSMDGVGRFVLPHAHFDEVKGRKVISYCDQLDIYRDNKHKIGYSPRQYKLFDSVIDEALRQPALPWLSESRRHDAMTNPKNQYYEAYEPLRQNIAVLRNSLYTVYFPDGEYNPEDPKDKAKCAKINQISHKLARKLKWEGRLQRLYNLVTFNFSENDICANRFGKYGQEHIGAQKMYEMLYKEQESMSWNPIKWFQGKATRYDWELPHPEESPFCQQDMREAIYNDYRDEDMQLESCSPQLNGRADEIQSVAEQLKYGANDVCAVAQMDEAQREESVELGREILRKLRDICAGRSERAHEGLDHQRQDLERANLISGLSENYLQLYQDLLARDPSVQYDSTFERARIAIGKLGHLTRLDALSTCEKEKENALMAAYEAAPSEYKKVGNDNEASLLRDVEVAMEEISRRQNVSKNVAPQVKSNARAIANNLQNTMSNARFDAASPNIYDKARDATQRSDQQREAKIVTMDSRAENLGSQYRA